MTSPAFFAAKLLRLLPPETAHVIAVRALAMGLGPMEPQIPDPVLRIHALGLDFPNPVGIAAGFDKDARAPDALLALGFGFAEAGTVTPRPQPGNPRPRMFRLTEDKGVINRLGFNNQGLDAFCARLAARQGQPGIVGANIGANKDSADRIADYVTGLSRVAPYASYVTANISSPNTPGLRDLQARDALRDLAARVSSARDALDGYETRILPLVLKIAPDLAEDDIVDAVDAAIEAGFQGMIVSNTTIARPDTLQSRNRREAGGLSGAPLFEASTHALKIAATAARGRLVLIGAGGVASGQDAYTKIRSGASLVQLYTAFGFQGPTLIPKIKRDLAELLRRDGFQHVGDAVGADL